jgi:hypothetical protein
MPKKEINDYVFYKFVCNDENIKSCYVGSTSNFKTRKNQHKNGCLNNTYKTYNLKIYEIMRENGGWTNWNMVVIGEEKQLTLTQARIKEEEYRVKLEADMNTQRAYISEEKKKEYNRTKALAYWNNNKDVCNNKAKEWNEKNKARRQEIMKKYYDKHGAEFALYKEYKKDKEEFEEYKKNKLEFEEFMKNKLLVVN